jgi:hypothetical protein
MDERLKIRDSFVHIYIFGFSLDSPENNSLRFRLEIDSSLNKHVLQLLGQQSLEAMIERASPVPG